ncbi:hypothetical protein CPB86DRAFT_818327 [Serendipita vermifera]|nr:hypothetical protein CPB86DRAFT_818327 [Serendipita vermifera]
MSTFSLSLSLVGPPALRSGFWYSFGSVLPQGHMLTLNNFMFQNLTLAVGLLVGWAASRLWRIGCVALFYFSHTPQPSWEQSQNDVFIVNCKSALEGCIGSLTILKRRSTAYHQLCGQAPKRSSFSGRRPTSYRKATHVLLGAAFLASMCIGLKLATPSLLALIPVSRLGVVISRDCGVRPTIATTSHEDDLSTTIRMFRLANAAFAAIDKTRSADFSDSPIGTRRITLPDHNVSLNPNTCPVNSSLCSETRPFTFTSDYTLTSEHFGVNIETPFSLQVQESCYRAIYAERIFNATEWQALMNETVAENFTARVLDYGYYVHNNGQVDPFTTYIDIAQEMAANYDLKAELTLYNSSSNWFPYRGLTQGGDTALLLYYIGGPISEYPSDDPIFATWSSQTEHQGSEWYEAESTIVPIICDTKYVFCLRERHGDNCSQPGGYLTMTEWLADKQGPPWNDVAKLVAKRFSLSPIYKATYGASSILAGQSMFHRVQISANLSALAELSRLSRAGMVMTASYAQLSVNGFLSVTTGGAEPFEPPSHSKSLCNRVIMETSTMATIPVLPYALAVGFSLLVIVISYAGSFRMSRKFLFSPLRRHYDTWTLHLPGQLHKGVTEGLYGKGFKLVDMESPWPNAPFTSGPIIISRNGVKRFGLGKPGVLHEASDSNQDDLLLQPFGTSEYSNDR